MKPLTKYKRNGLSWQITTRQGNAAIFQSQYGFEVIQIQSHNGRTIPAKDEKPETYCEPAEYPPSNEQWGSKGWTFRLDQLEDAKIKLKEISK
jgi:hypothetical protein